MVPMEPYTGDRFGNWTVLDAVIYRVGRRSKRARLCACSCGVQQMVHEGNLKAGKSQGCRACATRRVASTRKLDLFVGARFGDLVIAETNTPSALKIRCRCSCGAVCLLQKSRLRGGRSLRCPRCARAAGAVAAARTKSRSVSTRRGLLKAGMKFGGWTLIRRAPGLAKWVCGCSCGGFRTMSENLLRDHAPSCCAACFVASRMSAIRVGSRRYSIKQFAAASGASVWAVGDWCHAGLSGEEMLRKAAALHVAKKKKGTK